VAGIPPIATEIIDAVNALTGRHDGKRALHSKGALLNGTFVATDAGSALTSAGHMRGHAVPVVARFSNASGNPEAADFERDGRGLAVKFTLLDGSTTDMLAVTAPAFVARTPEDFLELMKARVPNPETGEPDMAVLGAYIEAHPEALPAIQAVVGVGPPASYATRRYNSPHAFRWIGPDDSARWIHFHWRPVAGEETLEDEAAAALGPDYLQTEIAERVQAGEAAFDLIVVVGEDGDPTDDPTAIWPEDEREQIVAGRLELNGLETTRERDGDVLVFDPTRVTDGIEPSDDPILHIRSHAYAESVLRRTGIEREA
jgi:catalase